LITAIISFIRLILLNVRHHPDGGPSFKLSISINSIVVPET
jgi:hypothetical protein